MISYSTNFYKDDFFETVVTINLTTMLVIVTLFVSVNENLPATSYMKMMDIWLLFNLFIPFLLILIHTYMENLKEQKEEEEKEEIPTVSKNESPAVGWKEVQINLKQEKGSEKKYRKAKHFAVVGIPIFSLAFIGVFFAVGYFYTVSNS